MASDLNVVYRISADITGLKDGVTKAQQVTAGLEKSADSLGSAFDSGFKKMGDAAQRGVGTVTSELLLAQKEVKSLQALVLKNADKPGFVSALGYELDAAIPKVNALERELKGLQTGLQGTTSQGKDFTSWLSTGNNLLSTFGVGLSVGAVVAFGKSLLEDADALVKMSDRTGASIQGLQKLQVAGDDAGNTIEQMTGAINQMQNRLAKGDDSAVSAVAKLGLSLDSIKGMKADDAFIAISDAIREVQDPLEQVRIANELFGKSGAEVLPTLKRGFDDLKNTTVGMSDATVKALDAAGDALARYYRQLKAGAANAAVDVANILDPFGMALEKGGKAADDEQKHLMDLYKAAVAQIKASQDLGRRLSGAIGPEMDPAIEQRVFAELLRSQEEAQRKLRAEEQKTNAEHDKTIEKLSEMERWGYKSGVSFGFLESDLTKLGQRDDSVLELKKAFDAVTKSVQDALNKIHEITSLNFPSDVQDLLKNLGALGEGVLPAAGAFGPHFTVPNAAPSLPGGKGLKPGFDFGRSFTSGFQQGIHDLPTVILSTIEGGGNVAVAIGSTFGKSVGDSINTSLQKSISESTTKGPFAKAFLSGLSDLIPVAGALIGPLIGKLFSIGGPSKQELAGRDVVAKFEQQFSGTEDMINQIGAAYVANGKSANDAQMAIQRLWAAEKQGADATKRALQEINDELAHHKEVTDAIHAEGFQSQDEIRHAADIANQAYEEMLKSGQYTADQVDKAYRHYQELLAQLEGAAGDAARAWLKAHEAADGAVQASSDAMQSAENDLKALIAKRDSLAAGIAAEAPEAVMGVIEAQQRGELKALDAQIDQKAADYEKLAKETGQSMADAIVEAISRIKLDPLHLGVVLDVGGGGLVAGGPVPGSMTPGGRTTDTTNPFAGLDYQSYLRDYWAPDREYVLSQIPHAASGGMVRDWGIEHFATGGITGMDSVLAMLQPNEMVLTHDQQGWVGAQLDAANTPIHVTVQSILDGQVIAESTVTRMARDKRGVGTKAKRALGVV